MDRRHPLQTLNGRLPLKLGSDRRETLPKRVSDDPGHFIFRRRTCFFGKIVCRKKFHDTKNRNRHFLKNYDKRPREIYDWIGFWNESWDVRHNSSKNGVLKISLL